MNIKHKADVAPASCGQHTPLPWKASNPGGQTTLSGRRVTLTHNGSMIADFDWNTPSENAANAEFAARACNSHQELLEALKAVSRLDYLQEHNALARQVKSAIAKAQGNTQ